MKRTDFHDIRIESRGEVAWILLVRPDVKNALRLQTLREVIAALDIVTNSKCRAVILRGEGGYFSSGGDIKEFNRYSTKDALIFAKQAKSVLRRIGQCPKPVISCVEGFALGAGCDLALACDYTVAEEDAKFGWPGTRLGLISPMKTYSRIILVTGLKRAQMLLLSGVLIKAKEAYEWGLVNDVARRDLVRNLSLKAARKLASVPTPTFRSMKKIISRFLQLWSPDRLENLEHSKLFEDSLVRQLIRKFANA